MKSILIFSSHLHLSLPCNLLQPDSPTKIFYAHLIILCFKIIYMFYGNFLKQCSCPISCSSPYMREQQSVTALQYFTGHNMCNYFSYSVCISVSWYATNAWIIFYNPSESHTTHHLRNIVLEEQFNSHFPDNITLLTATLPLSLCMHRLNTEKHQSFYMSFSHQ